MSKALEGRGGTVDPGGAEAAADMLAEYGWSERTWKNRSSQLRKWIAFCDDEGRKALPAEEGDVLAFIGYLSLEGRVGPASAPQYVSAVSRYHEDFGYPSPAKTRLVARTLRAYKALRDRTSEEKLARAGLAAPEMFKVVQAGIHGSVEVTGACAAVVFAFVFHCRAVTVAHMRVEDVVIGEDGEVRALLRYRKGKEVARPLRVVYPRGPSWKEGEGVVDLFRKWLSVRPEGPFLFSSVVRSRDGGVNLGDSVDLALRSAGVTAPTGYYYASHSARIGSFNELVALQFSTVWILHRLDWSSEGNFRTYHDSRIVRSPASDWFFAHLAGAAPG